MAVPSTSSPMVLRCAVEPRATSRALGTLRGSDRAPCTLSVHWPCSHVPWAAKGHWPGPHSFASAQATTMAMGYSMARDSSSFCVFPLGF
jgi:hypothetical protein